MLLKCIDASDRYGTGKGLLTEGQLYLSTWREGGYYNVQCDDGKWYTKATERFEVIKGY